MSVICSLLATCKAHDVNPRDYLNDIIARMPYHKKAVHEEDKEGRFDLRIDGVSHHSWFRRKKDEFVEALELPTSRRQNRGLKL